MIRLLKKNGFYKFKYDFINSEIQNKLDKIYNTSVNHLVNYSNRKKLDNEEVKALVRSEIRYSQEANLLLKELSSKLMNLGFANYFITQPYVIIHLPNDKVEIVGGVHNDVVKYSSDSYTIWTPLNQSKSDHPLEFYGKSHFYLSYYLFKILKKIPKKFFSIDKILNLIFKKYDVSISKKNVYIWNSKLLHKALINKTNNIRINLVFRISKNPFIYEPVKQINQVAICNIKNIPKIGNSYSLLVKIKNIIADSSEEEILQKINKLDYSNSNHKKYLSFACSLIAQRIPNENSKYYDAASLILFIDNLVSYERLINMKDKNILNSLFLFISKDSFQSFKQIRMINGNFFSTAKLKTLTF